MAACRIAAPFLGVDRRNRRRSVGTQRHPDSREQGLNCEPIDLGDVGRPAEWSASMKSPVESGDPRLAIDGFRRSLAEFATGVTVIAASVNGERFGLTSNSFASVSLDPPLVLWSIRRESKSFAAFTSCSHFSVNILAEDQIGLSQRFARSGPDKFDGVDCHAGEGGVPLFAGPAGPFQRPHPPYLRWRRSSDPGRRGLALQPLRPPAAAVRQRTICRLGR